MNLDFLKIKTPEELLRFMDNNINYGYLSKDGNVYRYGDDNFDENWYQEYILEDSSDVLNTKVGNCFDQTEFEREWFTNNNYEFVTIFEMVKLDYKNDYPTHSFLVYKDKNNKWNWFENSDYNNKGIHTFNTFDEAVEYQYMCYLKDLKKFNIKENEISKIIVTNFLKPKCHINANEYINHVINSERIK